MHMLKRLRALAATPPSVSDLGEHLAALDRDLAAAREALEEATAAHGDRIVASTSEADLARADDALSERRRDVERLKAARGAVASRLQAAQAAEASRGLTARWADAEKALQARDAALAKVERAAKVLAEAVTAAQQAARVAYDAMPTRSICGLTEIAVEYSDLSREVDLLLSVHSDGEIGPMAGSALWAYRRGPQFMDRVRARSEYWLSARPVGTETLDQPPPEAA